MKLEELLKIKAWTKKDFRETNNNSHYVLESADAYDDDGWYINEKGKLKFDPKLKKKLKK